MSHSKRIFIILYRLFFAGLTIAAIWTQIDLRLREGNFNPGNFFSFFTIESNIFAVAIFIIGALLLLYKKHWASMDMLRSAATLYMTMTGVIFALLLSGLEAELQTTIPWVNTVLHQIMPVVLILDWLFDMPRQPISFKRGLWWIVFPLLYLVYSLIRGNQVGWYPYPFIDPRDGGGYGKVVIMSTIILVCVLLIVWLMTWLTVVFHNRGAGIATKRYKHRKK